MSEWTGSQIPASTSVRSTVPEIRKPEACSGRAAAPMLCHSLPTAGSLAVDIEDSRMKNIAVVVVPPPPPPSSSSASSSFSPSAASPPAWLFFLVVDH